MELLRRSVCHQPVVIKLRDMKSLRARAFSYHLLISIVIASLSMAVVFGIWYVSPLAKASGVGHIFILLIVIDVIVGPILTLLIANEKKPKKELKQDISIIGIIQICALFYGLYTISAGRPAFIAFEFDRFRLVAANEVQKEESVWQTKLFEIQQVSIREPKDDKEKNDWLFQELQAGIFPTSRPSLYQDLNKGKNQILKTLITFDELKKFNSEEALQILNQYPEAKGYLPLLAPEQDVVVLIDGEGKIIKIVDLRPWE